MPTLTVYTCCVCVQFSIRLFSIFISWTVPPTLSLSQKKSSTFIQFNLNKKTTWQNFNAHKQKKENEKDFFLHVLEQLFHIFYFLSLFDVNVALHPHRHVWWLLKKQAKMGIIRVLDCEVETTAVNYFQHTPGVKFSTAKASRE